MVRTDGTLLPIIQLPIESPLLNIEDDWRRAYSDTCMQLHVSRPSWRSASYGTLVNRPFHLSVYQFGDL